MADCNDFTISIGDLSCTENPKAWATALVAQVQAFIDQVVACIRDAPATWCDICAMKAALLQCPLSCNTINFEGIQYAEEAGICRIPWPTILDARYGKAVSPAMELDGWVEVNVLFDRPFTTECVFAEVQITSCHEVITTPTPGPNCGRHWEPIIQEETITKTGFTVWFKTLEPTTHYVTFRWMAWGR